MRALPTTLLALLLAGCASTPQKAPPSSAKPYDFAADPYPSTYQRVPSPPVLLQHATVLTGTGARLENADLLLRDGRIAAIGQALEAPADAVRVDARGKWITPASSTSIPTSACIPARG
ncbi:hypothetical protein LJB71_04510 [Thermomonas sp. S9]|nr:hypothetical protein [Thermomonas sp. S9]